MKRIYFNKKIMRIIGSVILIVVLSVSFSDISINNSGLRVLLCNIAISSSPRLHMLTKDRESDSNMCSICIAENVSPLYKALCGVEIPDNGILLGEEKSVVGDDTFSLYDHIVYENEEYSGEVDIYNDSEYSDEAKQTISNNTYDEARIVDTLIQKQSTSFLLKNFYVVDKTTSVKKSMFKVEKMLTRDFSIEKSPEPQILIYHTHGASESFSGSNPSKPEEGIVGVGDYLTQVLTETYGYNVYHDRECYDMIEGKIDRSLAYAKALPSIKDIIEKYPSISVIIDLHRDGVGKDVQTVTEIDGVRMAKVMLFNGLSRNSKGKIQYLKNDNLEDNLAFSLQLKCKAMQKYPGLTKPIYLKGYRYNMHLLPRSLLIELGSQNNTLQEAKNSIPLLADVIDSVLAGRK